MRRIRNTFKWLSKYSLAGIWKLLRRLKIHLRNGRSHQFSPDPEYLVKEQRLLEVLKDVGENCGTKIALFMDEFSYYHWPIPGADWVSMALPPPLARHAPPGEKRQRIVGGLNIETGQVTFLSGVKVGCDKLKQFYRKLAEQYNTAETIYVIQDNWPVHFNNKVLSTVHKLQRIELVRLPTYSPWLNPIEKLWLWAKEHILKMHRNSGNWTNLKQIVSDFFQQFAHGSQYLLYRVGLRGHGKLAQAFRAF